MGAEIVFNHSDWADFLEQSLEAEQHASLRYHGRTSREGTREFYGTTTWQAAADLVETGWTEGREMMDKILTEVSVNESAVPKQRVQWDVSGACVDVGRFVSGEPECMMHWSKRPSRVRRCRILMNKSVSAGVSHETMKWSGACVLALVDRLESAGIRCEIDLGFCLMERHPDQVWTETITVKECNEPLHVDRMAFLLVHPASYRRLFFSYQEASRLTDSEGKLVARVHGCYGNGDYGMPVTEMAQYLPEGEQYDLVVPGMQLNGIEGAIAQMEKMFDQVCGSKSQYETLTEV